MLSLYTNISNNNHSIQKNKKLLKNSGHFLQGAGKKLVVSMGLQSLGVISFYSNYPYLGGAFFISSFFCQLSGYSDLTKSGEILQTEIEELKAE